MKANATFMEMYLSGHSKADAIEDYIQSWFTHEYQQKLPKYVVPLRTYLGFTEPEYNQWIVDPIKYTEEILRSRKESQYAQYKPSPPELNYGIDFPVFED